MIHGEIENCRLFFFNYRMFFQLNNCHGYSNNEVKQNVKSSSSHTHTCCSSSAWLKGSSTPVQNGLRGEPSPSAKWLCLESGEPGVCSNPLELFPSSWKEEEDLREEVKQRMKFQAVTAASCSLTCYTSSKTILKLSTVLWPHIVLIERVHEIGAYV